MRRGPARKHSLLYQDCSLMVEEHVPWGQPRGELLFLHGRHSNHAIWARVIDDLSRHYRCLALDVPGWRSSVDPDRVLSLLRGAGLISWLTARLASGPLVLVGHDTGGALAQACAALYPSQIRAVILINSTSLCSTTGASCAPGWPSRSSGRREFESRRWRSALRVMLLPVLLLWGALDGVNPPEIATDLIQVLPDVSFYRNEACGHWPCLDQPDWVISKMREFLFGIPSRAAGAQPLSKISLAMMSR